jgi:DUF4097 and DUF4098 domain-containing protein YvlB
MKGKYLLALAMVSAAFGAEESKLARDGAFWVQTVTGAAPASAGGRLRISTRGPVTMRGGAQDQIHYTITKRVKARSEAEAWRRLSRFEVRAYQQGDTAILTIAHAGDGWGSADVNVTAPRGLRAAVLETHGGKVDAADWDGVLEVQTGGGSIKLDHVAGSVTARTAGGDITLGTMGSSVRCISAGGPIRAESIRGDAWLETAGGDITANEVGGHLKASTAGGKIHVTRAGAGVTVNTAGGAIEVGSARGMVNAESASGPIQIGAASGVHCQTGSGPIQLTNVSGGLNANTAMGDVFARLLRGTPFEDSLLVTGLGDITVFVPSNLGVKVRAQIESASNAKRIVCDFPAVKVRIEGAMAVAEGAINGGGPMLRMSSAGGTIYIRREN